MRMRKVVIYFQISIFEPLGTSMRRKWPHRPTLWFTFKLVSLNHWEHPQNNYSSSSAVVIYFQISIFEPLGTSDGRRLLFLRLLWFTFKLVSLNHWEHLYINEPATCCVVIYFQISIFEPLGTSMRRKWPHRPTLWFTFKLVSLNHWEHLP